MQSFFSAKIKSTGILLFFVLMISIFIIACSDKKEQPPVALEKMQQVLLELQYAEVYATGLYHDSLKKKFDKNFDSLAVFYQSILEHHKLTQSEFKIAMDWYKAHPVQLDSLYARVLNTVNEQQAILEKEKADSKDSLSLKDSTSLQPSDTSYVKTQRDSLKAKIRVFDTAAARLKKQNHNRE